MTRKRCVIDPSHEPKFDNEFLLKMYKNMHLLFKFDMIMYEAQRHGETAAQNGSASALDSQDLIFAQYRESGVPYNNVVIKFLVIQMDLVKEKKYLCPLATQIPQAAEAGKYCFA
ncbi:unnamed protein product [Brachionus calyciflorus]|uniref:2-oxoisovalerate dehydrogenase subunit alpha n=1 Tax=Brachionus calyciflorus TaxID=104777 RepID=A0A813YCA9_9BILA|nr:unnamed protein product [Brachionus calyciflorus]